MNLSTATMMTNKSSCPLLLSLRKKKTADFMGKDLADEAAVIALADAKLAAIREYAVYRFK